MASYLCIVILTQFLISETISSYPYYYQQQPIHQQLRYADYKQYYESSYPNYYPQQTPKPSPPLPKLTPKPTPQPIQAHPAKDLTPETEKPPEKNDSKILNNLAIALQLLIVSNLINNPSKETSQVSESILELIQKPLTAQMSCPCEKTSSNYQMPNAKFLSTSNFDDGVMKMGGVGNQGTKSSRSTYGLMSPYDAVTNSGYSESFPSSYRQTEFLSPYATPTADTYKDLFSMDF